MKLHRNIAARRARAGFSLAELMVVVVILGLLAMVVVPNVLDRLGFAQKKKAEMDIGALDSALDTYAIENGGRYPESLEILVTPDENNRTFLKNYKTVPNDPWGNPYIYEPPQGGADAKIISYGKDGQPGGEGDDADIDSVSMRNAPQK
ncbi:MAG: type II secretion system major pseudopilin GspG [Planctomycetaceae bacterium]|nr:type II secretion system major pseudopilin GspG [Planctomycetaceae bacterium]